MWRIQGLVVVVEVVQFGFKFSKCEAQQAQKP
jgi:hypothetical protein